MADKKLLRYQIQVYILTFLAYAMSHLSRKTYTYVRKQMVSIDNMDLRLLGRLDTVFMFAYAVGSFISGNLGDRLHPPNVISSGLFGSFLCVLLLCVGVWLHLVQHSLPLAYIYFIFIWLVHGLFQSTGGPVNTAVMGAWFSKRHRGLIFGTWTCHQYVGNILGALISNAVLWSGTKYWWALIIAALANFGWSMMILFFLPARPDEVHLTLEEEAKVNDGPSSSSTKELEPISIAAAFRIPSVAMYAVAFGFFKLTNYTLFFWLPFYLTKFFSPAESNLISILYDVGMMPGGIIVGYLSDIFGGRRACVVVFLLVFLCPLLYVFGHSANSMPVHILLGVMGLMGILVGGPNNIITSAVAADLADHPDIKGNSRALGTVTGIINGSGSVTAALGLLLVTWMQGSLGWMAVWYFLIVCTALGCLLLMPKVCKELRA